MPKSVIWFLAFVSVVEAVRVPVTDACLPFLCADDAGNKLRWGSGLNALYLYNSDLVDIRAEGLRFISSLEVPATVSQTQKAICLPAPNALCSADGGRLLPSAQVHVSAAGGAGSGIFATAAANATTCGSGGVGRVFTGEPRYDISVCDVLASQHNLVYSSDGILTMQSRPIGIMVYTLVLILCSCNLGGIALYSPKQGITILLLIAAAFSLAISIVIITVHTASILTREDQIYCSFTLGAGIAYVCAACASMTPLFKSSTGLAGLTQGACLHALDALICAVYSSPENPYSLLFAGFVCARLWTLLYRPDIKKKTATSRNFEGLLINTACAAHLVLLSEMGVYPQLVLRDTWPALAATVLYLSNVGVKLVVAVAD